MEDSVSTQQSSWKGSQVYLLATACLVVGLAIGYFIRGSASPAQKAAVPDPHAQMANAPAQPDAPPQAPTLEQMKAMADKAAAPVIEKIKSNPKDAAALNDAGNVYRATHQFKLAAEYYQKALEIEPKNAAIRTDLASCMYYTGDVDGALAQLNKALDYDPNFFGALLNTGLIKLRAKKDADGAIASWEKILKTKATAEQKEMVKQLIANVKQGASQPAEPKS